MNRRGDTIAAKNERDFPYLVELALPPGGFGGRTTEFEAFHRERGIPSHRGRGRGDDQRFYIRYCFADAATADAFRNQFGGERLTYAPRRRSERTAKRTIY